MKILVIEIETEGARAEQYQPYLKDEAKRVWELYQSGVIRELYFRANPSEAVLMLDCGEAHEAQQILASLPLVRAGPIRFETIYSCLARVCAAFCKVALPAWLF